MDGNQFENLTLEQKLRLTVHRDVRAICREAAHFQGLEVDIPAMELIAELAWKKLQVYATDLELFAKYVKHVIERRRNVGRIQRRVVVHSQHAKRATINADDLKLLVRRNHSLKARISSLADAQSSASVKDNKKKKSTAPAVPNPSRASTSTIATTSTNTTTAIDEDNGMDADEAFIDLT